MTGQREGTTGERERETHGFPFSSLLVLFPRPTGFLRMKVVSLCLMSMSPVWPQALQVWTILPLPPCTIYTYTHTHTAQQIKIHMTTINVFMTEKCSPGGRAHQVSLRVLALWAEDKASDEAVQQLLQLGALVGSVDDEPTTGHLGLGSQLTAKVLARVFRERDRERERESEGRWVCMWRACAVGGTHSLISYSLPTTNNPVWFPKRSALLVCSSRALSVSRHTHMTEACKEPWQRRSCSQPPS